MNSRSKPTCWSWLALAIVLHEINLFAGHVKVDGGYPDEDRPLQRVPSGLNARSLTPFMMQIQAARQSANGTARKSLKGWGYAQRGGYKDVELDVITDERRSPRVEMMITWWRWPDHPTRHMFPLEEVLVCLDYLEEHP
jgi:hypothetical protein